ncbi:non-hydrolyzing UDP-N-acetylglucosamine 2-epimerase [Marinobacter algicola]|uniref:non-hydrolyzing UDP-N-acetylglucosamine 2-epimerase n=1 Tax=Marinobacter algicola TaxID=236100 RepID=UPI003BAA0813
MKVLTVIGARPQFIKAAALSRVFEDAAGINEVLVHTGQHYDANMSDVFFEEMGIPKPAYHLEIGSGTHGKMTGRQLERIEEVLFKEKPDLVLVYGDTNSTLAGALAAAKLNIPVAHVEAGLRSFNRQMPEEVNRILTDHISDMLFAPTEVARSNLQSEGVREESIHVVGDVMYDAALYYRDLGREPAWFEGLGLERESYVLCTIHRASNTDDPEKLSSILDGLRRGGRPVIMPLHPRTKSKIKSYGITVPVNIHIVEPVGFLEMVWLEANSERIATDSGGVQKEAFFHGKFCVTLREETEWVELVDSGQNVLVGAISQEIADALNQDISLGNSFPEIYGDGNAAKRICDIIDSRV